MKLQKKAFLHWGTFCLILLLFMAVQKSQAQPVMVVKEIGSGNLSSTPMELIISNDKIFFRATDSANGIELWASDGTPNGTVLVKDINTGPNDSFPDNLEDVNGTVFFQADDGINGVELWKSDGTATGTVLVKDINPGAGDSFPNVLTNINGTLLFAADDGVNGFELWKSDGTTAGTVLVKDINPGAGGSIAVAVGFDAEVNGIFFFHADDGSNGAELWKSDGTEAGTQLVKDIAPGSFSATPGSMVDVSGTLFFAANDRTTTGRELWKSDGTSAGTVLIKDINPGPTNSNPGQNINVNGTLFFGATDAALGFELWKSDGTSSGTVLVKDINPGAGNSLPVSFGKLNNSAFFNADDGLNGKELWKSDGTPAGTVLVKDINAGQASSGPAFFAALNNNVYFSAFEASTGGELWQSDGTTSGTMLVYDINPGPANSGPLFLTVLNDTLFFSAVDPVSGKELWSLQPPFRITLSPQNPPILIPAGGGQFEYTINLTNVSGRSVSTQLWNMFTLPNGNPFGPTIGPVNPNLESGASASRTFTQEIPGGAPSGQYTYSFNVGTFPNTIDDSDSFPFTKLSAPAAAQVTSLESGEWRVLDSETGLPVSDWDRGDLVHARADEVIPGAFVLEQNYPNPFNPSTTISYQLPKAEKVSIIIYDLLGRQVRELVNENQEAGVHSVKWDGKNQAGQTVAAGVYIYKITAGQVRQVRKMVFVK
ncbi:MAG: T9SS type A sorting domain-containing protein [Phycisphaerae bacterium]|nr:T9SS type A sorting domain-containing protein [candidate division KSB1 bacterium]NIV00263.1 T9SS type A sorting domain-containing protein [Phycisphaerae bacterium]NIT70206.1 T9SS type A sorting domain-containing protein [candidate division KSB1 bacterium]NIU23858.1 T9SS type A sorting domain-containing protein [candidate division KSB1 bacterium]NIV69123.1 T9SS type A sorting domain-containing protein [Phycisphaerae bacterium]